MSEEITVACQLCDTKRAVTVRFEREGPDTRYGWFEYDLAPPCPGLVEVSASRVTPDDFESDAETVLSDTVPEDQWASSRPWCPFDGQDDYQSCEEREVLAVYRDRKRRDHE